MELLDYIRKYYEQLEILYKENKLKAVLNKSNLEFKELINNVDTQTVFTESN